MIHAPRRAGGASYHPKLIRQSTGPVQQRRCDRNAGTDNISLQDWRSVIDNQSGGGCAWGESVLAAAQSPWRGGHIVSFDGGVSQRLKPHPRRLFANARRHESRVMCLAGRVATAGSLGAGADAPISAVLDGFGCCNKGRLAFIGFPRPSNPTSAPLHVLHSRRDHRS